VTRRGGTAALRRAVRAFAGPLVVAVAVQSVGNLGFHAVLGRLLPADGYGALGAVLAAMVMLGVPLGALQAAASTLSAGVVRPGDGGQVLRSRRVVRGTSAGRSRWPRRPSPDTSPRFRR
jgi:hypothetical protein